MGVSLPYPNISAGDDILAEPLKSNFAALAAKFAGGIVDEDISVAANIDGSKVAVATMPGDRVANKSLTQSELALLSVGTPELIDLSVTKGKVANSTLTQAQMDLTVQTKAFNVTAGGFTTINPDSAIPVASNTLLAVFLSDITGVVGSAIWQCVAAQSGGNWVGQVYNNLTQAPGGEVTGTFYWVYLAVS